jgi:hypothetical protein
MKDLMKLIEKSEELRSEINSLMSQAVSDSEDDIVEEMKIYIINYVKQLLRNGDLNDHFDIYDIMDDVWDDLRDSTVEKITSTYKLSLIPKE